MTADDRKGHSRIVLTGGPGGGKTTAADLFRRELGQRVVVVPEAGTMLFSGGFPRVEEAEAKRATQTAIYHVQRNLEEVQAALYPDRVLLCDRGSLDGAAYWPGGTEEFLGSVGSSLDEELDRYDAVVFFETAAAGGIGIEDGNPIRTETEEQALALDRRLYEIWSQHPRLTFVENQPSFFRKVSAGFETLCRLVDG